MSAATKIQPLRPPAPPLSPERQRLAASIAARHEAEAWLAKVELAQSCRLTSSSAVRARLQPLRDALDAARRGTEQARAVVEAALAGDPRPPSPVAATEAALAAAEAELARLGADREPLDGEAARASDAVKARAEDVFKAIRAVLTTEPVLADLMTEYDEKWRRVHELSALFDGVALYSPRGDKFHLPIGNRHVRNAPAVSAPRGSIAAWKAAIGALANDAAGQLPSAGDDDPPPPIAA